MFVHGYRHAGMLMGDLKCPGLPHQLSGKEEICQRPRTCEAMKSSAGCHGR